MKVLYSFFAVLLLFSSCRKDSYLHFEDDARLQFGPTPDKMYNTSANLHDTVKAFTFLTRPADVERDTLYFDLYLLGNVASTDRAYQLKQAQLNEVENAIPGIHFVPFDDPSIKHLYVLPANKAHVKVPVVLLKDATLSESDYQLRFKIAENENFKIGDTRLNWRKVIIADVLIVPSSWVVGYYGTYSRVKHRFMMQQTGMEWDELYFNVIKTDVTMNLYWQGKLRQLLHEFNTNQENIDKGDAPLMDENNRAVTF